MLNTCKLTVVLSTRPDCVWEWKLPFSGFHQDLRGFICSIKGHYLLVFALSSRKSPWPFLCSAGFSFISSGAVLNICSLAYMWNHLTNLWLHRSLWVCFKNSTLLINVHNLHEEKLPLSLPNFSFWMLSYLFTEVFGLQSRCFSTIFR